MFKRQKLCKQRASETDINIQNNTQYFTILSQLGLHIPCNYRFWLYLSFFCKIWDFVETTPQINKSLSPWKKLRQYKNHIVHYSIYLTSHTYNKNSTSFHYYKTKSYFLLDNFVTVATKTCSHQKISESKNRNTHIQGRCDPTRHCTTHWWWW